MLAISIPAVDYPARADIRRLIGEAQWLSLPGAVRTRFAEHAASAEYEGTFDEVSASFAGTLLATCCRLLGTPVTPFTGSNVPATVNVFATTDGGTAWQRIYRFTGRKACVVESVKRLSREGTLVEALPAGMRMALDVYALDGMPAFVSTGYYFELGSLRIRLPRVAAARRHACPAHRPGRRHLPLHDERPPPLAGPGVLAERPLSRSGAGREKTGETEQCSNLLRGLLLLRC